MPHLDVYKGGEIVETIALSASKRRYTVGRQEGVADILLTHASISREQATLTVSASGSVVVTDLGSAQGTYISGKPIEPRKPHLLAAGRSLVFGKQGALFHGARFGEWNALRAKGVGGATAGPEAGEVAGEAPPLALVACAPSGGDGSLGVHLLRRVSGARDGSAP
ncbi:hypothetical protein EMIHUDRAFT_233392 [Emiliania huxleyi CCMP1516]|uniref:FHA domain-containing protein n=2 Tax=Emiliania huxleyi TaxID=2903 RepID=A0A0D3K253_EMIH1|nr:hypothetical protein EMIHUDRAFT_233392 [Emiliania huxleyi CCMP1516]EOD29838.1 hypothetical protein EMIHUDRAFT_233392 [Emiliania huxleyi CCMP1516]|eukprot:XP_005782267.1 hypothetical protein EMIHUDRAFT_233392 [Emiliania huxleyi CCMP1516]